MSKTNQSPSSPPPHREHKEHAPRQITCMVITCSDSRTPETDTSGQLIVRLLKEHGHDVAAYRLVKDEPAEIRKQIKAGLKDKAVQAIIINGGTGISRRDSTFEAVDAMLEKRLDGFGLHHASRTMVSALQTKWIQSKLSPHACRSNGLPLDPQRRITALSPHTSHSTSFYKDAQTVSQRGRSFRFTLHARPLTR
ncbi:MAG: hypothetical protein E6K69_06225 [Nitrospirae bacterium]|nr:MAG: hypothetical protein E6K69_06225 [Nitrospirota bacterium]